MPIQSQSTIYVEDWELGSGPAELARVARQAEDSGFFYVAVCDHTAIPRRLAEAMSTTWYDTIATLGWLAGITTRIRLMSHVYIAALRHPLRAAKEFATLDVLSGGRVIIGVGAGHVNEEFDLFGPPFDERGAGLDEAIDAIAAALTDEYPDAAAGRAGRRRTWVSPPARCSSPRPPIWVGGSLARRLAARGDGAVTAGCPRPCAAATCATRWPSSWSCARSCGAVLPSRSARWPGSSTSGSPTTSSPAATVSGSPERIAENLAELIDMGVSHIQMRFPNRSVDELCDQIAAFGEQVGPLLHR